VNGVEASCNWGGGMYVTAPQVQLSIYASNGWLHNALQYHLVNANQLPLLSNIKFDDFVPASSTVYET